MLSIRWALFGVFTVTILGVAGCSDVRCHGGTCFCAPGGTCDIPCFAPPCHVDCEEGALCDGECANGECICRAGASCAFGCAAPPCHVECEGNHSTCNGVCANGTCACGPNSSCEFECQSGPCHVLCGSGSICLVRCPHGDAGSQNCDILECADGEPIVCADGLATTCGTPCPGSSSAESSPQ